jgi:molecular chaperone DnaK
MAKVMGIDLGTTNSVTAILDAGEPTVLENAEGSRLAPSVVAVNPKTGERLVGQVARRQASTNPENTIFSIKRFMGRKFDDPEVQKAFKVVPYKVTRASNGDVQVMMAAKAYSPPEVAAVIGGGQAGAGCQRRDRHACGHAGAAAGQSRDLRNST